MVIDSSLTLAWCFEDEHTEAAWAVLDRVKDETALVPSLWPLEIANCLLVAERKGHLTQADSRRFVRLLDSLPLTVDSETASLGFDPIISLAREHKLSSYDASYLELALRKGLPLATLDKELCKAARKIGVELV